MVMAPTDIRMPFPPKCPHPLPGGPIKPGGPFPIAPDRFDRFEFAMKDKNKDGKLSLDEWVRSKNGEVTLADVEKFKRYDRDDDGSVSQAEFLQGKKWDRQLAEWFKKGFDGVKEGFKPLTEFISARKEAAAE